MKHPAIPILCTIALGIGCTTPSMDGRDCHDPLDSVPAVDHWALVNSLLGEWKNTLDRADTASYEQWSAAGSDTLRGLGFVMVGADTVFIEELRITRTGTGIDYAARLSSQNGGEWVPFRLQGSGTDTLLFTNPQHDFPTRIRYVRAADGAWDVWVGSDQRSFALHFVPRPK
jgi:hypothetical protein